MKNLNVETFGPWAVVTGASSGIGKEFARQLAEHGFNVVLVARRLGILEEFGAELNRSYGISTRSVEADLSDAKSIEQVKVATRDLDVGLLINNAGTGIPAPFLSLEWEEILEYNQLNSLSALALTHHFGRSFVRKRRGGILISSVMGAADGLPYMASMAGSKAMNSSLGLGLYDEWKGSGVHLTVVSITPTDTPILDKLGFRNSAMPLKPIAPRQAVGESLRALARNKRTVMPSWAFRTMNALLPASLKRSVAGATLKKNNGIV